MLQGSCSTPSWQGWAIRLPLPLEPSPSTLPFPLEYGSRLLAVNTAATAINYGNLFIYGLCWPCSFPEFCTLATSIMIQVLPRHLPLSKVVVLARQCRS